MGFLCKNKKFNEMKINDNPFGWGDWQKVRNQLTNQEELYETLYTDDGNLQYFNNEMKTNRYFRDKGKYIKRQFFATNAQPDKGVNKGEVEHAFFKLVLTFLDEKNNINFDNHHIDRYTAELVKDGRMYKDLNKIMEKWDALAENLEDNKENISILRDAFFEFFNKALPQGQKQNNTSHKVNKYLASQSLYWKEQNLGNDGKGNANVADLKLTKLENALWVMKNCIVAYKKKDGKTSMAFNEFINKYLKELLDFYKEHIDEQQMTDLAYEPTSTGGRYDFNHKANKTAVKKMNEIMKDRKTTTDPQLRQKHDDIWERAKESLPTTITTEGYYYDPTSSKWLVRDNTDLGHDLLKKWGREANIKTTFIQPKKENVVFQNGAYPSPRDYYEYKMKGLLNILENPLNYDADQLQGAAISVPLLKEVIRIYEEEGI